MPLAVNEPSAEVKALAREWDVLDALMGGTLAMRDKGKALLPQWPNEEPLSYAARLNVATLFPAYQRTVNVMASKPFAKPLTLSDDAPASIQQWAQDIDRQGCSLHAFAAEMFMESFYGLCGVLVEYPRMVPVKNGRTVAQVEASGARPYFVRVMHHQLLGWQTTEQGGRVSLSQLRLLESREAPDGPWGTTCIPQVRVLTPGAWQLWEQASGKLEWVLVDEGTTSLDYIPFVPFYGKRTGFMCGRPTLADLAHLNVKHWQSQSDQDTILHVSRVPILTLIGADDSTSLAVGAAAAVKLPEGADLKFVEHSGNAIKAGAEAIADLRDEMVQVGAELLIKRPGNRTMVGDANDAEANKCDLQRQAETFADAIDQALQVMADYARLPTGGTVSLFDDYGASTLSDASAVLVKDLALAGLLTHERALRELQRRGVLSEDFDPVEESDAAKAEGPALAMMQDSGPPNGGPPTNGG